jgi:uncharacterized membrane protein (DUF485 family)
MFTSRTNDLQDVLSDDFAPFTGIINYDLDYLLTPMTGKTEIKIVVISFHCACFLLAGLYTIRAGKEQ